MSIINYAEGFTATGQVTKMATFNSKGGGLMVQVQLPLEGELAANIAMHLGNIAEVTMKFSSVKEDVHSKLEDQEDEREGQQALDFIGVQVGRTAEYAADEPEEGVSEAADEEGDTEGEEEAEGETEGDGEAQDGEAGEEAAEETEEDPENP